MASALDATAWTAVGTFALAAVTAVAVVVGILLARSDRHRDDAKRAEDRVAAERARREDREEAERRRREEREETDRREATERRDREDFEARQVLMTAERQPEGSAFSYLIKVTWPHIYPVKQVEVYIASQQNSGGPGVHSCGHAGSDPYVQGDRICQDFRAERMDDRREKPIVKFVDWHGNLYYQYRGYTQRFPQNADFGTAAVRLDEFIRTGPKAD